MRIIRLRDIVDAVTFLVFLPVSWFLPTRCWPPITRLLGGLHQRIAGGGRERLEIVARDQLGLDLRHLETGFRQHNFWELLEILREHAPWGWKPEIKITGREYLDEALAKGKGAVLWYCPFTHADIVFKKGLCQAGYDLNYLSSFAHGYSTTRFGLAFLNPLKTGIESRYVKERCVIGPGSVGPVIRSLLGRLRANEVVSVTAVESGKRYGERNLLGGRVRLAKGAPNFALTTGAALIPVFVVPDGDGYEIRFEPPLVATSTDPDVAEEEHISAYAHLLRRYVVAHPHLWRGWLGLASYWKPHDFTTQNAQEHRRVA